MSKSFKKKTGIENIQAYLESGRSITPLEALSNFGIFRLASAIEVLRKRGLSITTEKKTDPNGKTYARYSLVKEEAAKAPEAAPQAGLKVGDEVRVKSTTRGYGVYNGKTGVVKAIYNTGLAFPVEVRFESRAGGDWFKEAELEVVPAKKELKMGARVRVLSGGGSEVNGKTGTVEAITDLNGLWPYEVRVDGKQHVGLCPFYAHELEVL